MMGHTVVVVKTILVCVNVVLECAVPVGPDELVALCNHVAYGGGTLLFVGRYVYGRSNELVDALVVLDFVSGDMPYT